MSAGLGRDGLESLWAVLFPARCFGCRRRGAPVCSDCERVIAWLGPDTCPRCARVSRQGRFCGRCRGEPGPLDGLRGACAFEGIVRQAVHGLKYRQGRFVAPFAAELLVRSLAARPLQADVLVPVPLAAARRRERGYNQSELIAEQLGAAIGVPVVPSALERVRATPRQVGLTGAERRLNVQGAFACPDPSIVAGRRVVLIDDVATTGSTLEACAEPLKVAGAIRVFGLVVAHER